MVKATIVKETLQCFGAFVMLCSLSLPLYNAILDPCCLQALLQSSHMYAEAKHSFAKHGVVVDNVSVDVAAMQKQKSSAVESLTKGIEGLFKKNKVSGRLGCENDKKLRSQQQISSTHLAQCVGILGPK